MVPFPPATKTVVMREQQGENGNLSIDPLHAQDESATSTILNNLQLMVATQTIQIVRIHTKLNNDDAKTGKVFKLVGIHTTEIFYLYRKNITVATIATVTPIVSKSRRHRPVGDHHLREAIPLVLEVPIAVARSETSPLPPRTPFRDRTDRWQTEETSDPSLRVISMLPILPRLLADIIHNPINTKGASKQTSNSIEREEKERKIILS